MPMCIANTSEEEGLDPNYVEILKVASELDQKEATTIIEESDYEEEQEVYPNKIYGEELEEMYQYTKQDSFDIYDGRTGHDCQWATTMTPFVSYDLRPLTITGDNTMSYHVTDADKEGTGLHKHTKDYSFAWNVCGPVTVISEPLLAGADNTSSTCKSNQRGAAIQYLDRREDATHEKYKECHVLGAYSPKPGINTWRFINIADPSQGVSITYPPGPNETESCPSGEFRSATVVIECHTGRMSVVSALEETECNYVFRMKSWHGCPLECPHNDRTGLCTNHGICAYDDITHEAYCRCNDGWRGVDCSRIVDTYGLFDTFSHIMMTLFGIIMCTGALYKWHIRKMGIHLGNSSIFGTGKADDPYYYDDESRGDVGHIMLMESGYPNSDTDEYGDHSLGEGYGSTSSSFFVTTTTRNEQNDDDATVSLLTGSIE